MYDEIGSSERLAQLFAKVTVVLPQEKFENYHSEKNSAWGLLFVDGATLHMNIFKPEPDTFSFLKTVAIGKILENESVEIQNGIKLLFERSPRKGLIKRIIAKLVGSAMDSSTSTSAQLIVAIESKAL